MRGWGVTSTIFNLCTVLLYLFNEIHAALPPSTVLQSQDLLAPPPAATSAKTSRKQPDKEHEEVPPAIGQLQLDLTKPLYDQLRSSPRLPLQKIASSAVTTSERPVIQPSESERSIEEQKSASSAVTTSERPLIQPSESERSIEELEQLAREFNAYILQRKESAGQAQLTLPDVTSVTDLSTGDLSGQNSVIVDEQSQKILSKEEHRSIEEQKSASTAVTTSERPVIQPSESERSIEELEQLAREFNAYILPRKESAGQAQLTLPDVTSVTDLSTGDLSGQNSVIVDEQSQKILSKEEQQFLFNSYIKDITASNIKVSTKTASAGINATLGSASGLINATATAVTTGPLAAAVGITELSFSRPDSVVIQLIPTPIINPTAVVTPIAVVNTAAFGQGTSYLPPTSSQNVDPSSAVSSYATPALPNNGDSYTPPDFDLNTYSRIIL